MKTLLLIAAFLALAVPVANAGNQPPVKTAPYVLCGAICLGGNTGPPHYPCNAGLAGVFAYNPYPYLWECLASDGFHWIYQGIRY